MISFQTYVVYVLVFYMYLITDLQIKYWAPVVVPTLSRDEKGTEMWNILLVCAWRVAGWDKVTWATRRGSERKHEPEVVFLIPCDQVALFLPFSTLTFINLF